MPFSRALTRALLAALAAAAVVLPAQATGSSDSVEFTVVPGPVGYGAGPQGAGEPPGVPNAPPGATPLGLSDEPGPGRPQSVSTKMGDFAVNDASGSGQGWSITVSGEKGRGLSPVLRQYCPSSSCGPHSGPGYVAEGLTLPPNSLTLDSSGAQFRSDNTDAGQPPRNTCGQTCFIDTPAASPSKIAAARAGSGKGAFEASGFSASSVKLVEPSRPDRLPEGEIYRVDISWSLNTGP